MDFKEIYSPVVKHRSVRTILASASQVDLELEQLDVKTAFLHKDLENEIFMRQPGVLITGNVDSQVCLLKGPSMV